MFTFARVLSGFLFIGLGLNQIFHFKFAHDGLLAHLQILTEATSGFLHGLYQFLDKISPLLIVMAFLCQIALGVSLLLIYRLKLIGKIALLVWLFYAFLYYPFYLFQEKDAFILSLDFGFAFFQFIAIAFCLSQKKVGVERHVSSTL